MEVTAVTKRFPKSVEKIIFNRSHETAVACPIIKTYNLLLTRKVIPQNEFCNFSFLFVRVGKMVNHRKLRGGGGVLVFYVNRYYMQIVLINSRLISMGYVSLKIECFSLLH